MKKRMGATHFLMKTLPKVATEIALCVPTYNLDARLEHRRRARAARSDQRIVAGTHRPTPTEMGMRRPRIAQSPRSGCPFNNFFSNWVSGAGLGASAGVYSVGFDIFTRPRPLTDFQGRLYGAALKHVGSPLLAGWFDIDQGPLRQNWRPVAVRSLAGGRHMLLPGAPNPWTAITGRTVMITRPSPSSIL